MRFTTYCCTIFFIVITLSAHAADTKAVPTYEDELIRLRLMPRTAEQMAGFFEARGFPAGMIDELSQYCFFTAVIKNKSKNLLWLDMSEWHFVAGEQDVRRIPRSHWPPKWVAMRIPLAAQSTFRWTLLPEKLDFQPDEGEGGNVILERTNTHFSLTARFGLGQASQEGVHTVRINDLECAASPLEEKP